jgi:NOL1/NOP2/fmu family ribosome biogenesis protein
MTPEELAAERRYRIQERLGILCGSREPTIEQIEIAEQEAEEWLERMRNEN